MTLNYVLIGKRIKNVRLAKGLSQSALAEVSGVSNQTICYIETGLKCPSLETLVALANSLSVTADELLGENLLICRTTGTFADQEILDVFQTCSAYERRILIDNARHLKTLLHENTYLKPKS